MKSQDTLDLPGDEPKEEELEEIELGLDDDELGDDTVVENE